MYTLRLRVLCVEEGGGGGPPGGKGGEGGRLRGVLPVPGHQGQVRSSRQLQQEEGQGKKTFRIYSYDLNMLN